MPDSATCNIPTLVDEQSQLNVLDQVGVQAAKVYILALILKELGGEDNTDICALADSLRPYDGYSQYQRDSARLAALIRLAEYFGVTLDDAIPGQGLAAVACAHCCSVTNASLENAETLLWCRIAGTSGRAQ
jgi:hypothetical protein